MPGNDEAHRRHATYYEMVLRSANNVSMQGGEDYFIGLASFDREWDNIQQGHEWVARRVEQDEAATRLCEAYSENPFLLEFRLHANEFVVWMESAIKAARFLNFRDSEGLHLGNLGLAYQKTGRIQRALDC